MNEITFLILACWTLSLLAWTSYLLWSWRKLERGYRHLAHDRSQWLRRCEAAVRANISGRN